MAWPAASFATRHERTEDRRWGIQFSRSPITAIGLFLPPAPVIPIALTWENFWRVYPDLIGLGSFLARHSYAVYIIHSTLIVLIGYGLYLAFSRMGFDPGTLLKFAIATILAVPASYAAAYLVCKIPGLGRIV